MRRGDGHTIGDAVQPAAGGTRRQLALRDSLTFVSLTLVAIALAGVNTFLFRSFESHREALGESWARRGAEAMREGRPADAVAAFRTSLTYQRDSVANQMTLAEALAESGRTAQAENYFLNLWQAKPGDGFINLQLARLVRGRGDVVDATNYYRAAIFGTWNGDAITRRRDARLELSRYLVEQGQSQAARAELLIVAGNNSDAPTQIAAGRVLEEAGDPKGALAAYRAAARTERGTQAANARAGELCYEQGDYVCAQSLLTKALQYPHWTEAQKARLSTVQRYARELHVISFAGVTPFKFRAERLLEASRLAKVRLSTCRQDAGPGSKDDPELQAIQARWRSLDAPKARRALGTDEDLQDQYAANIFDSEKLALKQCGHPDEQDVLLLHLSDHPETDFGKE